MEARRILQEATTDGSHYIADGKAVHFPRFRSNPEKYGVNWKLGYRSIKTIGDKLLFEEYGDGSNNRKD